MIGVLSMSIVLPKRTVMPDPIPLYWKRGTTSTKFAYLQALSSRVRAPSREFVALFAPIIPPAQLEQWIHQFGETDKAVDLHSRGAISPEDIIRDTGNYDELCLFRRWICEDGNQIYFGMPVASPKTQFSADGHI